MHVMDSVRGHLLVLQKAKPGTHYIITGRKEDNLYLKELCSVIGQVIQERNPKMKVKTPTLVFSKPIGLIGAIISETVTGIFNKPNLLSRDSVRAGSIPTFYSYEEAERDVGYGPLQSVRQAIEDTYDYYDKEGMLDQTTRYLDRR